MAFISKWSINKSVPGLAWKAGSALDFARRIAKEGYKVDEAYVNALLTDKTRVASISDLKEDILKHSTYTFRGYEVNAAIYRSAKRNIDAYNTAVRQFNKRHAAEINAGMSMTGQMIQPLQEKHIQGSGSYWTRKRIEFELTRWSDYANSEGTFQEYVTGEGLKATDNRKWVASAVKAITGHRSDIMQLGPIDGPLVAQWWIEKITKDKKLQMRAIAIGIDVVIHDFYEYYNMNILQQLDKQASQFGIRNEWEKFKADNGITTPINDDVF